MPPFLLFSPLADLPLYQSINIGLVVLIPVAMIAASLFLRCNRFVHPLEAQDRFPDSFDTWLALFIVLFLSFSYTMSALGAPPPYGGESWLGPLILILLFSPAIIRVATHLGTPLPGSHKSACFLGGLFVAYGFSFLFFLSGIPEWLAAVTEAPITQPIITTFFQSSTLEQILIASSAIVAAPLLEETFFRGYLYPVLKRFTGMWPAMIGASLFFGAVHMSLVHCLPLAVFGFIMNLVYVKTGRLSLPIAMHASFNAINVLIFYLFPDMAM